MGAKITTEIDPYIKQVFESMRDILGLSYKDILEEGILAKVREVDPIHAEEIEIMRLEFELSSHKMHLATLRVSAERLEKKSKAAREDTGIEAERQEWFRKKAAGLAKAVDEGYINWDHIAKKGPFANSKEAKDWTLKHLPEWRENHEN